jgi:mRNA interferase HigB
MNIIVKRAVLYYCEKYPLARISLLTWYHEFSKHDFKNFNALKTVYGKASLVAQNRVIFNIKGNDFRLIISINFRQQATYVIWFGTHHEYTKIDAATIAFNTRILSYKPKEK